MKSLICMGRVFALSVTSYLIYAILQKDMMGIAASILLIELYFIYLCRTSNLKKSMGMP